MNRDEWIENYKQVLLKMGIDSTRIVAITNEEYGLHGINADLSTCPFCCAAEFLSKHNPN